MGTFAGCMRKADMQVNLKEHTLEQVQELLPVRMTGRDLDFVVDWLVWVGWSMVKVSNEVRHSSFLDVGEP
ncbi:protein of unknown function [Methylococcus capsulatus]|uniref:Uncharacterized protein n=1 Tax=Methylococcus capsulatus TaxID=414 RepID=A0AA35XUW1_METCP|nr:protein of unknown function [Methylococcus capsulatus]